MNCRARRGTICSLSNDNLVITLVSMHNLSLFRYRHVNGDQFLSEKKRGKDVPPAGPKICTHKFREVL